jgi:hypothetical protein
MEKSIEQLIKECEVDCMIEVKYKKDGLWSCTISVWKNNKIIHHSFGISESKVSARVKAESQLDKLKILYGNSN